MKHSTALVTIATGKYLETWKSVCEPNWREYADRHGYDLICIDTPPDSSERARQRSPSWQKCLILSQSFAQRYQRIIWLDADVLINAASAPCIDAVVPPDKVGAVDMYSQPSPELHRLALDRAYEYYATRGLEPIINYTAREYYTQYGLPDGFDHVVQDGVLVLSPQHHRHLLEKVYFGYEERGGRKWHNEMRPLSYELLKADAVSWIDFRFCVVWDIYQILYYPFLLNTGHRRTMISRLKRKAAALLGRPYRPWPDNVRRTCISAALLNSFFLHFGGDYLGLMKLADLEATSWRDCKLVRA